MRKLKQFSLALAVVCALSTACGQSGSTETTAASAETTAEPTAETASSDETKAAVASGRRLPQNRHLTRRDSSRYLQRI